MPVHVEEMNSEVAIFDGDLPLSPAQIDKLVKIILQRLEQKQSHADLAREAMQLTSTVIPPPADEGR